MASRATPRGQIFYGASLALAVGLTSSSSYAEVVVVSSEVPEHRLLMVAGWDQTWICGLGYGQKLGSRSAGGQVELEGLLTVPVLNVAEVDAAKVEIGAQLLLTTRSGLGVAAGLDTAWAVAHDPTGTKLGWLAGVTARPGYYAPSGAVAVDLAWREGIATYMWHSENVEELFRDRYPEGVEVRDADLGPDDGWYRFPVSRLRLGLAGGYVFGARVAAQAVAGFDYSPQAEGIIANPSIGGMPFYAKLGGDYRW